ncbi:MAG: biopolymer transporter ExbD [Waddliaceae bacterium]|nr:biopolymer transporter ExbD [Waddliaceae bacterium]
MSRRVRKLYRNQERFTFEGDVNLTPLIDVVFVVLIMFMIIAPMLELEKIQLAQASKAESEEQAALRKGSAVSIHLDENNSILFNRKEVSLGQLHKLLFLSKERYPHITPQFFPDKHAYFGAYKLVLNALEESGYETVDIVLDPK